MSAACSRMSLRGTDCHSHRLMAIRDSGVGMLAELVKSVSGAAEKYRKYYIGRVNREYLNMLESLLALLYEGKEAELAADYPKALLLGEGVKEFSGMERTLCLMFLFKGLQRQGEDAAGRMSEFIKEVSTGKYGMEDLPYPE